MKQVWQLQAAKARFSEVVRTAIDHGPQWISLRGEVKAVVLDYQEYQKLKSKKPGFVEFIRRSPLAELSLQAKRDQSLSREIKL